MIGIEVRTKLAGKLIKNMNDRLRSRVKPGLDMIGAMGYQDVMEHFRDETGPRGRWKGIDPRPKRKGQRAGVSDKVLQDTGLLRSSINFKTRGNEVHIFTKIIYAAVHNFGYAKRNIAQRKFLWLSKGALKRVTRKFKEYIVKGTIS